jgi:PAS domain S-box-containing protein
LRQSEENLHITLESIGDGVIATDTHGNITRMNPVAASLTGWTFEQALGKALTEVFHIVNSQTREAACNPVSKVIESGEIVGLANHTLLIAKDGSEFQITDSASPILDAGGALIGVVLVFRDVSEDYRIHTALRESEARMSTIVETAVDAIITIDELGNVESFNPAAERMFGYSGDEMAYRNINILMPSPYREEYNGYIQNYRETGHRKNIGIGREFIGKRKDGSTFPLNLAVSECLLENRRVFTGFIRDLTDIKQEEEEKRQLEAQLLQAQKMEAIGTLAGGIAHDFNNILAGQVGYLELSRDLIDPGSELYGYLSEAETASFRARDLVSQILTFSRQMDQDRKPLRIQTIIHESLKLLRKTIPATIVIDSNISNDCGPALADATRIHQVVMNLCTNAYHAMRKNGGTLVVQLEETRGDAEVITEETVKERSYARLTVSDSGHGIDEAVLDRIFDPYYTTKQVGEGTGLGLSTVLGIVKEHDGTITVQSKPGEGTAFEILLPIHVQNRHDNQSSSQEEGPAETRGQGEHILFVDDEKPIIDFSRTALQKMGTESQRRQAA